MKDTVLTALGQSHLLRRGQHPWASHRWVVMALKFKLHSSFEWLYSIPADDLLNWKLKLFFPFCSAFFFTFFSFNKDFYSGICPHLKEPATEISGTVGPAQWPPGAASAMLQGGLVCQTSMCIPAAPSCCCPWTKLGQSLLVKAMPSIYWGQA